MAETDLKIDQNGASLGLADQTQLTIVKQLDSYNLSSLPIEMLESLLTLSHSSNYLNVKIMRRFLEFSLNITDIDLSIMLPSQELGVVVIDDEWLEILSKCSTLQSLSILKFCRIF